MAVIARHALLVGTTIVATLVVRALAVEKPATAEIVHAAPESSRSPELAELRDAVTELRVQVGRIRATPAEVAPVASTPPQTDEIDPQVSARAVERVRARIASAEASGVWSDDDARAVFGEFGSMSLDERREQMARVHAAIIEGRMMPRHHHVATTGDRR